MILKALDWMPDLPANVASIVVLLEPVGPIETALALNQVSHAAMRELRRDDDPKRVEVFGYPVYWAYNPQGGVELWPIPHQDMKIKVRDRAGRDISGGKPVAVPPVDRHIQLLTEAWKKQQKEPMTPLRVERFSLIGEE
jgi:hypothetical protein